MGLLLRAFGWVVALGCMLVPLSASAQTREDSPFDVSLHGRTTRSSARAEQVAWLSVTLPLEAWARPAAGRVVALAEPPPVAASGAAASSTPAAAATSPSVTFEQLRALSEFSRRACGVALSVAGVPAERRRLDSLSTRARASAALPEIRLRAQRNTDQALRWAPTSDDPYRVTQADGAGTTLEASATFRLDRLLFAREELNTERLRQQAAAEHLKLERRVLDSLLELFRAREQACGAATETDARATALLHGIERFTELDVMTAGWFSSHAEAFSRAIWGFPEAVLGVCSAPLPTSEPAPTNPVASVENSG